MRKRVLAIVRDRGILRLLIIRDLKIKYADSYLGWLWSVLEPLLMALVYWFVFTHIFPRPSKTQPYIVFLLLGVLPWHWAQGVINSSTGAISGQRRLVRSTRIPREIWVLRIIGSKYIEFVLSLPIVIVAMILFHAEPNTYTFTVPLAMLLQAIFLTGVALTMAPLSVLVPDIDRLVRIIMRILFYLTPVLYGMKNVNPRLYPLYALNPLAGQMDLYRASVFPEQFVGWWLVASSAVLSVLWLIVGFTIFTRLEKQVLKNI
jgi:ABC-2 type transport system permease protein